MEKLTEVLTLETLPKAFSHLTNEVSEIKSMLLVISNIHPYQNDQWLDLNELCVYLPDKPSKPTVYSWVNSGTIPVYKGAKKLRFLKSEIDNWLKLGRKKLDTKTAKSPELYLKTKNK